jgi:secondary thiamine-phosphate synthase enzyme
MHHTDVHGGTARTAVRRHGVQLEAVFGHCDVTSEVREAVRDAEIRHGLVTVAVVGSTAAVTTIEYEPGALADLRDALERLAPANAHYEHNARWGDGNGFSHLRSALLKTSVTIPVVDSEAALGTWQQVIVVNLDNRPRTREVIVSVVGV